MANPHRYSGDASSHREVEKADIHAHEKENIALDEQVNLPADFDARSKALVRKFDLRLLPILISLYIMSFLDRVNIGKILFFGSSSTTHKSEI